MKTSHVITYLGVTALLLLPIGCAKYKAQPLYKLSTAVNAGDSQKKINLAYHVFTKEDCKRYLGRNVIAKGYQPIQITLVNNTDQNMCVSLSDFSLPCVDPQEVAQTVHTSTKKRAAGYGIGALFLPILAIPAIVDGLGSSEANRKLDDDFARKAITNQVLAPKTFLNGLVFVPTASLSEQFSLTLVNQQSNIKHVLSTNELEITI